MVETNSPNDSGSSGPPWHHAMQHAVRDIDELAGLLDLRAAELRAIAAGAGDFPLLAPRSFVARMNKRDLRDPLLLQILPRAAEDLDTVGFSADPLREQAVADQGVIQKYRGRALLIASGACPVHCRYCFRRGFPYREQLAARDDWARPLDKLRKSPEIDEVILSGGDPLSVSNRRLGTLFEALESVESIRCIRIHTRFPIMVPERVDAGLLTLLERSSAKIVIVIHCNHANEIDADVEGALAALSGPANLLLNQSVLLSGINDEVSTLAQLSRRLFSCGVVPYYLHSLDPIAGAAHFEVDEARARMLLADLRSELPGYLVPKLVRETPGELSKTPL